MANSTVDGSVVIDVDLNVSDAEHELTRLKKKIVQLESELGEKAFKRGSISSELIQARKELEKLQSEKPALLVDGTFADNDEYYKKLEAAEKTVFDLDQQLKKIDEDISAGELTLEYTKMRYGEILPLAQQLRKEEDARIASEKQAREEAKQAERQAREEAKRQEQIAKEAQAAIEAQIAQQRLLDIKENAAVADQKLVDLQEELLSLTKRRKELESAGVGFGYQEYDDIAKRTSEINAELKAYQDELIGIKDGTEDLGNKTNETGKAMSRFGVRIMELAKSAFIFNVISRGLSTIQQLTMKYIKTNDEARQAIAQMKGALLTLAQPLIEVIIPAFTLFVNILTRIITAAAQIISSLFGKTVQQSKDGAKALNKEANAIGAVGEAAEDAAGSLAGFDEINSINTENAKGAGGAVSAGNEIMPDFDFTSGKYKDMIDELMVYLSGALLVIGAILLFSGANIPLGLGLMVLGATVLAQEIAANWGAIDGKINEAVQRIFMILGGALLVLGAILCFSGANIPLGIGLMILGAIMLAAAATLNWGSTGEELRNALATLLQIIGPMIAIIGVLLAVTGHLLLGIGLIIAGVALFTAGEAAGEAGDFIENIRSKLSDALGVIGAFLAVVGILLIVTGHFLTGLGVLIAGIAALEYSEVRDDEGMTMQDKIKTVLEKTLEAVSPMIAIVGLMLLLIPGQFLIGLALLIAGIAIFEYSKVKDDGGMSVQEKIETVLKNTLKIATTFLLVLGLLLLLIPPMWPMAFALIAAGVVGLVTTTALDSDAMKNKLKEMWQGIQNWWNSGEGPKKFLTIDYWKDLGKDVIDGFLGGLKDAWNGLTSWFSGVWDDLFGNRKVSVGVTGKSSGGNYSKSASVSVRSIPDLPVSRIPALAQGAVIPPNREFLAVLGDQRSGTNIEAPLSTIEQALENVMTRMGGSSSDIHITIKLDGKEVARSTVHHINDMTRQAGKPVLLI